MPLAAPALLAGLLLLQPPPGSPSQPPAPPPVPPPSGSAAKPAFPKDIGGKDLAAWIKEMKDNPDPRVREDAVLCIPLFGPAARKPAFKPLLAAVNRESDPGVWLKIIDTLGVIGADTPEDEKDIAGALALAMMRTSPGGIGRLKVAQAIANYGPAANGAIANLTIASKDPAYETRRAVAFALGRIGLPADAKKGPNPNALKTLVAMLSDVAAPVRFDAIQSLILLGPPAYEDPSMYPVIVKPFLDAATAQFKVEANKPNWIWLSVLIMRYDGGQYTDANIKKIADFLVSTDGNVRVNALTALAMLGERTKPFVPEIARTMTFDDPETQKTAVDTLGALGELAKVALPDLERFKATVKDEQTKKYVQEAIDAVSGKKKPDAAVPPKK